MPTPQWANLLLRASRAAQLVHRAQEIVRDEILFAFLAPQHWADLTVKSYDDAAEYLPGGEIFERGLFHWERVLLSHPRMPKAGRILLPAAGGGREAKAFAERGYEVVAIEPAPKLSAGIRQVASSLPGVQVMEADYRKLVEIAREGSVPPVLQGPFDLVWMGWGSFAHLAARTEARDTLLALRQLAPKAPVVMSFYLRAKHETLRVVPSVRARQALRRAFSHLGGDTSSHGLEFTVGGGFACYFSESELRSWFADARCDIAVFEREPFPHALIVPSE